MNIIRPVAGRMRPKTRLSGIFKTNRSSPVSVSRLTRILVPNPKNAFQSPGTHSFGFIIVMVLWPFFASLDCWRTGGGRFSRECGQNFFGARHPAENAALGLDHLEAHHLEFR